MKARKGYENIDCYMKYELSFLIRYGWHESLLKKTPSHFLIVYENSKEKFKISFSFGFIDSTLNFGMITKEKKFIPFWKLFNILSIEYENSMILCGNREIKVCIDEYITIIRTHWIKLETTANKR